jgi:DNA processing protein
MRDMEKIPETLRAALGWNRLHGPAPRRFWAAAASAGGWEALLESGAAALAGDPFSVDVSADLDRARASGAMLLTPFYGPYPRLLREICDAPLVLWARGDVEKLALPMVAIVGSRASTPYGSEVARRVGEDLSAAGICIVSGMARGIDAAAHQAALQGPGGTIGVLGSGITVVYPSENRTLWEQVERGGLLLSEFPPDTPPLARNFPIRNRIIAGMSVATIVVEAASRSGSLITARLATEYGRDVFAVPGSIFSDGSEGCHALLRDGAILCTGASDVFAEILPGGGVLAAGPAVLPEGEAGRVLAQLRKADAWSADDLAVALDVSADRLLVLLFDLEARGFLRALPGSLYAAVR